MATRTARRNTATIAGLLAIVGLMGGLAYASVPLYRWFCQVTGFGGTVQVATATPGRILDRVVTIRFNADVNSQLPWNFQPVQRSVKVRLGEETLAFFRARNIGDRSITGTATFNVTPAKAGIYFNKIDCFCFTEQTLSAGQTVDMPVSFYVDPEMAGDRNLDEVTTITLSYTFFAALNPESRTEQRATTASN